jgi:hypothetical protein
MSTLENEMYGKFTQVPNLILTDTNIKHSAFRQYCYLLSKPTGWTVRNNDISNQLGIAESTIASNFKNLIENMYMNRYPNKDLSGKFVGGYKYHIYVVPTVSTKNTELENSGSDKNIDYSNTYTSDGLYTLKDTQKAFNYIKKKEKNENAKKYGCSEKNYNTEKEKTSNDEIKIKRK